MQEVGYTVINDLALVGYTENAYFRRQSLLKIGQNLIDILSHLHNVLTFLHLDAEHDTLLAIIGNIAFRFRIFTDYPCYIFQPDITPLRISIDNQLLYIIYRIERSGYIDRLHICICTDPATGSRKAFGKQRCRQRLVIQTIPGQASIIQIYGNLFFLYATDRHTAYTRNTAHTVLQIIHIVIQFPIGFVFALHGNQKSGCIPEIIHDLNGQYIRRQLSLERLYSVLEFAPELIFIVQIVIQLHLNIDNSVTAFRERFSFLDLLVTEYIVFQGLGNLFYHLFRRISRCHCHYDSLTDRKIRELIFTHLRKTVNTKSDQTAHHQNHNLPVMHGPLHCTSFFLFHNPNLLQ